MLIGFFHGLSISFAFLFCYASIREVLKDFEDTNSIAKEYASVLGGLLYTFSPTSVLGWDKVLITHFVFFLNPLMFYLILRYLRTQEFRYIGISLVITFIFSSNFSFAAAPAVFSFYPLTVGFLVLYTRIILKKKIIWPHILVGGIAFIGLQLFHLLPQLVSAFSFGSVLHTTIFTPEGKFNRGLDYFNGIVGSVKASYNFFLFPQLQDVNRLKLIYVFLPIVVVGSYLYNRRQRVSKKLLLLTGIYFLIALFFSTAHITDIGLTFYRLLFFIPGFAMFRNFYGQWGGVMVFSYCLLFGESLYIFFKNIRGPIVKIFTLCIGGLLLFTGWPLLNGQSANPVLWQSKGQHIAIRMDPDLEDALTYLHDIAQDGKVLTLPLTDPGYQIVSGLHGGAYQGPSMVAYVAGRQDFAGLEELGDYRMLFTRYIYEGNYESLKRLLGTLNIRYIFYDRDPRVYDRFPRFPYDQVRTFMPVDQNGYEKLLSGLEFRQLKQFGNFYRIYEINPQYVKPEVYLPNQYTVFHALRRLPSTIETGLVSKSTDANAYIESDENYAKQMVNTYVLQPESLPLSMVKNTDPPTYLHFSFAKISPLNFLYPLVLLKEKRMLDSLPSDDSISNIDRRLLLSAKRLYELEKWGNDMPVVGFTKSVNELKDQTIPTIRLKNIYAIMSYGKSTHNTWEAVLSWYYNNMVQTIEYANKLNPSSREFSLQKYVIGEYFMQHKGRLRQLIFASAKSTGDKQYLFHLIDSIFVSLDTSLAQAPITDFSILYKSTVNIPNNLRVKAQIPSENLRAVALSNVTLEIGGMQESLQSSATDKQWMTTQPFLYSAKGSLALRYTPYNNLLRPQGLISTGSLSPSGLITIRTSSVLVNGQRGLVWSVEPWEPNQYYLVTFLYQTHGNAYRFRVVEKNQNDQSVPSTTLVDDYLQSSQFITYQAVVHAGSYADLGYVQLAAADENEIISDLDIKDFSMVAVPQPALLIGETPFDQEQKETTVSAQITKLNPTKYIVNVSGSVHAPFYVLLNQSFNTRWKAFIIPTTNGVSAIPPKRNVSSIVGLIAAIAADAIDRPTGYEISSQNHFKSNGYGNAWLIRPEDVQNSPTYTVVIEFGTQQYFYFGALISGLTLSGILFYLFVYRYVRKIHT